MTEPISNSGDRRGDDRGRRPYPGRGGRPGVGRPGRSRRGAQDPGGTGWQAGTGGGRRDGRDQGRRGSQGAARSGERGSGRPAASRPGDAAPAGGSRPSDPRIPEDVTGQELDRPVRDELRSLPSGLATNVARHLVMTGRLLDSDPEGAAAHAAAARRLAPRLAVVREATALAAYVNGEYAAALRDFRALRRMTGSPHHLPLMADCERGLGRPERALELARSEEAGQLEKSERVELRIVEAGARRDLGQLDAAILALSGPDLRRPSGADWWPRLAYAFADALLARGRQEEARLWFARAAEHDAHGETGAVERLAELDGVTFLVETDEPEPDSEESGDGR